jgi:predicted ATP-grasp superfamily ATP-dependent carboligase
MARILVLDGHCNAALAFVRSLGRAGHWVAVGSSRDVFAPAALSRYCRLSFAYPVSTDEPTNFVATVLAFAREHRIDLIAPMTDWTTFPLARYREQFRDFARVAAPSLKALETVSDKYRTVTLAGELKVPVPETLLLASAEDLEPARRWPYPIVVKDRFSVRWLADKAVFGATSYAHSWDDLSQRVQQRLEQAGDVLVQRFVRGEGVGFSCFALEGKAAHLPFQWQRVREENPCGGASSARKSVGLHSQVLEFGGNLMARSEFQGIGMVEFKHDPATGRVCLMEINGRPWGSLQLAVESGIDYPRHVAAWFLEGVKPPEQIKYKRGITCRRFVGDLNHLACVRRGRPAGWPGAYPGFWSALVKVSMPWYPGLRYEDLYLRDIRPGLAELCRWFSFRLRKLSGMRRLKVKSDTPSTEDGLTIKGIVHCHTTLSYDGEVKLSYLCNYLRQRGFSFVALTEHPRGVSARDYEEFVRRCREASDGNFVVIPGVEFRCDDGVEIAGVGVSQFVNGRTPDQVVAQIREQGGFAIWVHPWRNRRWRGSFLDCDAVEVLNLKVDGTLAPNLSLLRRTVEERKSGRHFYAIFGMDFHGLLQPLSTWVECQVADSTPTAIIEALRKGRFVSRVPYAAMSSSGAVGAIDYALMVLFRTAFLAWAGLLRSVPGWVRNWLVALSRPALRLVRGGASRQPKHFER